MDITHTHMHPQVAFDEAVATNIEDFEMEVQVKFRHAVKNTPCAGVDVAIRALFISARQRY
jgi:hypothetical protein